MPRHNYPRMGQVVLYHFQDGHRPDGMAYAAAIVTRVFSIDLVNLTVFGDLAQPICAAHVPRGGSLTHLPWGSCWTESEESPP
jgi:hypothetical protein